MCIFHIALATVLEQLAIPTSEAALIAFAIQMLSKRGVRVCAQVPESSMMDEAEEEPQRPRKLSLDVVRASPTKSDKSKGKESTVPRQSKRSILIACWKTALGRRVTLAPH